MKHCIQRARSKGIKLAQVAERTKIPLDRLQALESDRYVDLPDDVYMRGAIRNYSIFLGLDPTDGPTIPPGATGGGEARTVECRPDDANGRRDSPAVTSVVVVILILVALVALHIIVL